MAEELLEFENTVEDEDGRSWVAKVLGAEREGGSWVGWIRFRDATGDELLDTERETTQPNRDDLSYWATGLTYFYLEGALRRARRRQGKVEQPIPPEPVIPTEHGPRIELRGLQPDLVKKIMGGTSTPRPGAIREVPDSGVVVYEGSGGGPEGAHYFALRYGSRNSGAVLANWLWSRIQGTGVSVRVDGEPVELSQGSLSEAIAGP